MYRYYITDNKIIAVTTYAGKTVRGVAKCDPHDTYDFDKGKALATARCNLKVAEKRRKQASQRRLEAEKQLIKALGHNQAMCSYESDANYKAEQAKIELKELEAIM